MARTGASLSKAHDMTSPSPEALRRRLLRAPGPHQAAATRCGGDDAAWFEGLPPLHHANQRPNARPASSTSAASCRATAEAPTATA
jgi:hypothetical protein